MENLIRELLEKSEVQAREIESLDAEIKRFKELAYNRANQIDEIMDGAFYQIGKQQVYQGAIGLTSTNAEGLSFLEWCHEVIYKSAIPDSMSFNDFVEFFYSKLKDEFVKHGGKLEDIDESEVLF